MLLLILLSISVSLDALGAGLSFGIRNIKISITSKIVICLLSVLFAFMSVSCGNWLVNIFPPIVSKIIGSSILIIMGLWIIFGNLRKSKANHTFPATQEQKTILEFMIKSLGITICVIKNPVSGDIDKSGSIDVKEAILLGFALSVDMLSVGVGFALSGLSTVYLPFMVGITQILFLYTGCYIGAKLGDIRVLNDKVISFISGLILITMAIVKLF